MAARDELLALLEGSADHRRFFEKLCREGPHALRGQSHRFADELADKGSGFAREDLEDVEDRPTHKVVDI